MKMKPHRVGARYSKDSISLARRFDVTVSCRDVSVGVAGMTDGARKARTSRPGGVAADRRMEAKIYPGRMRSRGGAGVHVKKLVQAGQNFKGL
jgi:hypothetical protein